MDPFEQAPRSKGEFAAMYGGTSEWDAAPVWKRDGADDAVLPRKGRGAGEKCGAPEASPAAAEATGATTTTTAALGTTNNALRNTDTNEEVIAVRAVVVVHDFRFWDRSSAADLDFWEGRSDVLTSTSRLVRLFLEQRHSGNSSSCNIGRRCMRVASETKCRLRWTSLGSTSVQCS